MRPVLAMLALLAATALAGCGSDSAGSEPDADGDGLFDREELQGWNVTLKLQSGVRDRVVTSDPFAPDTDHDGVPDHYELLLALDPRLADSDADGLSDCEESLHTNRTTCESPIGPGATDGGTHTVSSNWDTDGDGLSDGEEVHGFAVVSRTGASMTYKTDPRRFDTDSDFLSDGLERSPFRSNPTVADTDGDGCRDGLDIVPDAVETMGLRFGTLTLNQSARVRFHLTLNGVSAATGPAADRPAGTTDLSALAVEPVRSETCTLSPTAPWITVALVAERLDNGGNPNLLDLHSSNPGGAVQMYWNAASGQLAWDFGGESGTFAAPAHWSGADGSIEFTPLLAPGQAT